MRNSFGFGAALLASGLLAACVGMGISPSRFNALSLGMTKSEVIKVLGRPDNVRAGGGQEYLIYETSDTSQAGHCAVLAVAGLGLGGLACGSLNTPYFVRIVDGLVAAYGELGDFDSTKDPSVDIDLDIKQESTPSR